MAMTLPKFFQRPEYACLNDDERDKVRKSAANKLRGSKKKNEVEKAMDSAAKL